MEIATAAPYRLSELETELARRGSLRFARPGMESGFLADFNALFPYARRNLMLAPFLFFLFVPLFGAGLFDTPADFLPFMRTLEYWLLVPVLGACLLAVSWPRLRRWSDAAVAGGMLLLAVSLELIADVGAHSGFYFPGELPALVIIATLTLARLSLHIALPLAGTMLVLIGAVKFSFPTSGGHSGFAFFAQCIAAGIGAIAAARQELSTRRAWLQNHILHALMQHDALTSILNRRGFDQAIERLFKMAQRELKPVVVLVGDIDHFKALNDRYGHDYGDECLKRIADVLTRCGRRPLDLAARLGGEEFALVWYDVTPADARRLATQAVAAVQAAGIQHEASPVAPMVTMSAGAVYLTPADGTTPREVLAQADALLYRAKQAGRNRLDYTAQAPPPALKIASSQ